MMMQEITEIVNSHDEINGEKAWKDYSVFEITNIVCLTAVISTTKKPQDCNLHCGGYLNMSAF